MGVNLFIVPLWWLAFVSVVCQGLDMWKSFFQEAQSFLS